MLIYHQHRDKLERMARMSLASDAIQVCKELALWQYGGAAAMKSSGKILRLPEISAKARDVAERAEANPDLLRDEK